MKKVILTILVIAALTVSCSYGMYYTELYAYDSDADWQRIEGGRYAYLTTLNSGIGEGELFSVLSDFFIAAERIYVTPSSEGTVAYYRVVNESPRVLPLIAYLEQGGAVEKLDFETADAYYLQMEERESYTFNNVLMWMAADLGKDYALIQITPTAGGATQHFCIRGDFRENWRWYWDEIAEDAEVTEVSVQSREVMDVFWYGNESYDEAKEQKESMFHDFRALSWYEQPFPLPVSAFSQFEGGNYDL